jgi:hypothetical protein
MKSDIVYRAVKIDASTCRVHLHFPYKSFNLNSGMAALTRDEAEEVIDFEDDEQKISEYVVL